MPEALVDSHRFGTSAKPSVNNHDSAAEGLSHWLDFKCPEITINRAGQITILFKADAKPFR